MAYKRKTEDEFEIQGNYGQGWELATTEVKWRDAKEQKKCYQQNEPGIPFRIVHKRVPITKG
jgi:hypothetical protein